GSRRSVTDPPAASIFSRALAETACATTVSFVLSSPLPRIFTSCRVVRMTPTCLSNSGVTSVPASNRSSAETLTGCEYVRNGPIRPSPSARSVPRCRWEWPIWERICVILSFVTGRLLGRSRLRGLGGLLRLGGSLRLGRNLRLDERLLLLGLGRVLLLYRR